MKSSVISALWCFQRCLSLLLKTKLSELQREKQELQRHAWPSSKQTLPWWANKVAINSNKVQEQLIKKQLGQHKKLWKHWEVRKVTQETITFKMKSSVISALRRAESLLRFQATSIFDRILFVDSNSCPWIPLAVTESIHVQKPSFRFSNLRILIDPGLKLDT